MLPVRLTVNVPVVTPASVAIGSVAAISHRRESWDGHPYQLADHAVALAQDVDLAVATQGQADVGAPAAVGDTVRIAAAGDVGAARKHCAAGGVAAFAEHTRPPRCRTTAG